MASPFAVFRRNQRVMLAVLGVVAMIAFVFLPIFSDFLGTRPSTDEQVASTRFGPLHESTIGQLLMRRGQLNAFVSGARSLALGFNMGIELFGPAQEEAVVDAFLLARRGEELGLVVSDQAINEFLKEITLDRVKPEQLQTLRNNFQMTQAQLFEGLRHELLSLRMRQLFLDNNVQIRAKPPAQRWDYYRRVNTRASVELVALNVADYVGQVSDPPEADLVAFYEQHKNSYSLPGSPEPGFRQPARGKFEYFKASYADFVKPSEVTEADVEAHYNQYKDERYLYTESTGSDLKLDTVLPDGPPGETPPAETPPAETPPSESSPAAEPSAEPQDPAPSVDDGSSEAPSEPAPNEAAPTESPAPESPPGEPAAPESPQAQHAPNAVPLVVRGQAEEPTSTTAAEAPTLTTASGTEPPPVATGDPAAADSTTPGRAASAAAASRPIADDLLPQADILAGENPKYDPVWKVADRIREEISAERATKRMQEVLRGLQQTVSGYFGVVAEWNVQQPDSPVPAPPNFQQLAGENGVKFLETGLVSALEAQLSSELGRAAVGGSEPFHLFAFGRFPKQTAQLAQDSDGNQFLFWKSEESADKVPTLEEIRAEVVLAWKQVQARELARKRAEELAGEARAATGKSLEEAFINQRGLTVRRPRPFSWLVFDAAQQFSPNEPPRLGEVEHVDQPGAAFMEAVFTLEPGQVGVTANNPQSTAYVVRLLNVDPPVRVLRSTFMADNYRRYVLAGLDDDVALGRRWREQLVADSRLEWIRPPRAEAQ